MDCVSFCNISVIQQDTQYLMINFIHTCEKLLVSHRVPPQVADRGTLTRYGGYRGNKIPGVHQN